MANNDRTKIEPLGNHARRTPPGPKLRGRPAKHGLYTMKRALMRLGANAIDRRYAVGKNLTKWRKDLINDLGGESEVGTAKSAIIDLACKSKLILDSIDAWILTQPSLVNMRKRQLLPVVVQRQQLAEGLAKYLGMLGLERRQKQVTLDDILREDDQPAEEEQK